MTVSPATAPPSAGDVYFETSPSPDAELSPVYVALLLTLLGSLGTALGGLVVVLTPTPDQRRLGILQVIIFLDDWLRSSLL